MKLIDYITNGETNYQHKILKNGKLVVTQSLYLMDVNNVIFPDNVEIYGHLLISNCKNLNLGKNLNIHNNLLINNSNFKIPESITIQGIINCSEEVDAENIPKLFEDKLSIDVNDRFYEYCNLIITKDSIELCDFTKNIHDWNVVFSNEEFMRVFFDITGDIDYIKKDFLKAKEIHNKYFN